MRWIKRPIDLRTRTDMRYIRHLPNGCAYYMLYGDLLEISAAHNGLLLVTGELPYTTDMIAFETGLSAEIVNAAIDVFRQFRLIDADSNGVYRLLEWDKYAPGENSTERVRKHRERKKAVQPDQSIQTAIIVNNETEETIHETTETTPKKKRKAAEPEKHQYALNVLLTVDEYLALNEKYGAEACEWMISKLDNHKGANGTKYKSDYRAILNWVVDAYTEHCRRQKPTTTSYSAQRPAKAQSESIFERMKREVEERRTPETIFSDPLEVDYKVLGG